MERGMRRSDNTTIQLEGGFPCQQFVVTKPARHGTFSEVQPVQAGLSSGKGLATLHRLAFAKGPSHVLQPAPAVVLRLKVHAARPPAGPPLLPPPTGVPGRPGGPVHLQRDNPCRW